MDKFTPAPNQTPLPSIYNLLDKAKITQDVIDEAVKDWGENNPEYDGLLTAEIKSEES